MKDASASYKRKTKIYGEPFSVVKRASYFILIKKDYVANSFQNSYTKQHIWVVASTLKYRE